MIISTWHGRLGISSISYNLQLPNCFERSKTNFHVIDNIPSRHGINCPRNAWDNHHQRFTFIVDCQPLCQIVNGKCPLLQDDLAPVYERMTGRIFKMLGCGWRPNCLRADPVNWHRREHNEIADFIVNHTMECRKDWQFVFKAPCSDFNIQHANLICHSDGGTRAGSCSASGWIVEACVIQGDAQHTFPLAMAGSFFDQPVSSFSAELIALDAVVPSA